MRNLTKPLAFDLSDQLLWKALVNGLSLSALAAHHVVMMVLSHRKLIARNSIPKLTATHQSDRFKGSQATVNRHPVQTRGTRKLRELLDAKWTVPGDEGFEELDAGLGTPEPRILERLKRCPYPGWGFRAAFTHAGTLPQTLKTPKYESKSKG